MKQKLLFTLIACFAYLNVFSQMYDVDLSFDPGTGFNSIYVMDIVAQTDGKVLVSGAFTTYNGTAAVGIVRINTDGTIDNTFDAGTGFDGCCNQYDLTLQADGKILVSGYFSQFQGNSTNCIIRLNSDGSKDNTFNSGTGFGGSTNAVNDIALQADGKIIVVGNFSSYNGTPVSCIVRLNADGSIDNTFNSGTGFTSWTSLDPKAVCLQSDGKILVGGAFTAYNGTNRMSLVRINSDGSLDNSFTANTNSNVSFIQRIVIQPDQKIILGGACGYSGSSNCGLTRLNTDGSLDATFNGGGTGTNSGNVASLTLQSDGKILLSGAFTEYNGTTVNRFIRLNADASLDNTFSLTGTGFDHYSWEILKQTDGTIYAVGHFSTFNGISRSGIIRLGQASPVGINTIAEQSVNIWNNGNTLTIDGSSLTELSVVKIQNLQGQELYTTTIIPAQTLQIDLSQLAASIAIISVSNSNHLSTYKVFTSK